MPITVDFSRSPTAKEKMKLQGRAHRLGRPDYARRLRHAYDVMPGALPLTGLKLRSGFAFRIDEIDHDSSDRKAPPRHFRPPATRLQSPRGANLRFELSLIALAQSVRRPGDKAKLNTLGLKVKGSSRAPGWADLLVADSEDGVLGSTFVTARDKRTRSVRSSFEALQRAGLVGIPGVPGERDRFERFVLLNEQGVEAIGEAEEYTVPTRDEEMFVMPAGFVTNGWVHVLEDSEIALLLMVGCRKGGWPEGDLLVIPPDVRLRQYGIHRDAYSAARKTLEWFGLLRVEEVGRHGDGRAENGELRVHRLGLEVGGFDRPAIETVARALQEQLARR